MGTGSGAEGEVFLATHKPTGEQCVQHALRVVCMRVCMSASSGCVD